MRTAIFVYETTTLTFKAPSSQLLAVRLQRLDGDAPVVAKTMVVKRGIYKIESGSSLVPEPNQLIDVVDEAGGSGDPKDPYPPIPRSQRAVELVAELFVQRFFANTLGDESFTVDQVSLDLSDVPPEHDVQ